MRLVGIDYGAKRVGIAVSDEEGKFGLPYGVWLNTPDLVQNIKALCLEKRADAIIVGESRNLDGSENPISSSINLLKTALESELSIPIYLHPEFYTSAEAKRIQGENKMHDASAAALILKSYIDQHSG